LVFYVEVRDVYFVLQTNNDTLFLLQGTFFSYLGGHLLLFVEGIWELFLCFSEEFHFIYLTQKELFVVGILSPFSQTYSIVAHHQHHHMWLLFFFIDGVTYV
jgi:hypothetical protein